MIINLILKSKNNQSLTILISSELRTTMEIATKVRWRATRKMDGESIITRMDKSMMDCLWTMRYQVMGNITFYQELFMREIGTKDRNMVLEF